MTVVTIGTASKVGFRYGNPAIDCGRAQLRTQCRQLATVVTVEGAVVADNVEAVTHHVTRFVLPEKPVVLDLGAVSEFAADAVALLAAVETRCIAADVEWALVASPAVLQHLDADYAADESVPQALHRFSESNNERRRLMPLLTKAV